MTGTFVVTDQRLAMADISVSIDPTTPSGLWQDLAEQLDEVLRLAALSLTDGCADLGEYRTRLEDDGVTALDGLYASACADIVALAEDAHERLSELTMAVGSGQTPVNLRSSFEDILRGPVALLWLAADVCPSIELLISGDFRDVRPDQREQICQVVSELAQAASVRMVASGLTQRWLRQRHREQLPQFSPGCNPRHSSRSLAELVKAARDEIDPDSSETTALRELAAEPVETLPYKTLKAALPISASRVSQVLGRLEELDLIERYGPRTEKQVELTKLGSAFVDALDAEIGEQATLESEFSRIGKGCGNVRVNPTSGGGRDDPAHRGKLTQVRQLGRTDAIAAHATAVENGVGLVDHPVEKLDDGLIPLWQYDDGAARLIVSAQYHRPHQFLSCIARSLASGLTFSRVLTPERLDGDRGGLGGLELADPHLLRSASCLGWLKDRDATGEDYVARLTKAREDLLDLTRRTHHKVEADEGGDCGPPYAQLARDAKGLIGTMLQLCRLANIDVMFQIRLPEFSRNYKDDHREQLIRMLSGLIGPGSSYGHFSVQRQLFEGREEKRASAITPDVDAADPYGTLMPSISVVGPGVTRLAEPLEKAFTDLEPREDAPELAVRVPLEDRTYARAAYAEATRAMCRAKDLQPTREAVSVLQALCGSPYDVADALQSLGKETKDPDRAIRAHDLRYALSTLDTGRILPDLRPTVGKVVHALLGVSRRLTQSELADLADVKARSIRNNRELLELVSLLDVDKDGYRLMISFPDERRKNVLPNLVSSSITAVSDIAYELLSATIEDVDRLADPDDPLGECFYWPQDIATLCDRATDVAPWIRLAADLLGEAIEETSPSMATLGPSIEQTALPDAAPETPEVTAD